MMSRLDFCFPFVNKCLRHGPRLFRRMKRNHPFERFNRHITNSSPFAGFLSEGLLDEHGEENELRHEVVVTIIYPFSQRRVVLECGMNESYIFLGGIHTDFVTGLAGEKGG